jgi:hypothetical protein
MAPKPADKAKKEAQQAKAKAKAKVRGKQFSSSRQQIRGETAQAPTLPLLPPAQAAEDKTFGLKNKNKSAKVQK